MSDTWYWNVIAFLYLFALVFLTYKNRKLRNMLAEQANKIVAMESKTKKLVKSLESKQSSDIDSSEES